ncbi:hypothetical protein [Dietzia sp. ANT_WB102]|uniref:hypothetical protein n=1 Tax=Dietzia sp. ANT_WB102 TaxID=2597345 RepID=UPI0011F01C22|nr:hypothetical protein [Dietzia sp. ANT_WB102]KAA0919310.1 hypothetical protein FQ137_08685 [Dietzia sp. ANT_WB102]
MSDTSDHAVLGHLGAHELLATTRAVRFRLDLEREVDLADFIGMSNRLELHRSGLERTTAAGTELPLRCDTGGSQAVSARLRPDDITLHRVDEDASSRKIVLDATLLSAEFGGRHYDVQVGAGRSSTASGPRPRCTGTGSAARRRGSPSSSVSAPRA